MELLKHEEIASVTLFDLKLSESELMVYESCLKYVLDNLDDKLISEITGCENKEELTWFQEDLRNLIINHVMPQYIPEKYK